MKKGKINLIGGSLISVSSLAYGLHLLKTSDNKLTTSRKIAGWGMILAAAVCETYVLYTTNNEVVRSIFDKPSKDSATGISGGQKNIQ